MFIFYLLCRHCVNELIQKEARCKKTKWVWIHSNRCPFCYRIKKQQMTMDGTIANAMGHPVNVGMERIALRKLYTPSHERARRRLLF